MNTPDSGKHIRPAQNIFADGTDKFPTQHHSCARCQLWFATMIFLNTLSFIIIIDSMTSVFNTDASLPYNHDFFESLIVKKKNKAKCDAGQTKRSVLQLGPAEKVIKFGWGRVKDGKRENVRREASAAACFRLPALLYAASKATRLMAPCDGRCGIKVRSFTCVICTARPIHWSRCFVLIYQNTLLYQHLKVRMSVYFHQPTVDEHERTRHHVKQTGKVTRLATAWYSGFSFTLIYNAAAGVLYKQVSIREPLNELRNDLANHPVLRPPVAEAVIIHTATRKDKVLHSTAAFVCSHLYARTLIKRQDICWTESDTHPHVSEWKKPEETKPKCNCTFGQDRSSTNRSLIIDKEQAFTIIYRVPTNRSRLVRSRLSSITEAIGIRLLDAQLCVQKKLVRLLNLNWGICTELENLVCLPGFYFSPGDLSEFTPDVRSNKLQVRSTTCRLYFRTRSTVPQWSDVCKSVVKFAGHIYSHSTNCQELLRPGPQICDRDSLLCDHKLRTGSHRYPIGHMKHGGHTLAFADQRVNTETATQKPSGIASPYINPKMWIEYADPTVVITK
ncbi:hypothetical protein CLF_111129 [Clonorchis sinensis]|uniref:Uncharacterized protein n=1 Tax=Clonorchis sinensis TaxID=79923 RepID=G7YLF3_CLOSI|nr:hypothetical protein CLF_111129 [Clonorchis sinensis]